MRRARPRAAPQGAPYGSTSRRSASSASTSVRLSSSSIRLGGLDHGMEFVRVAQPRDGDVIGAGRVEIADVG